MENKAAQYIILYSDQLFQHWLDGKRQYVVKTLLNTYQSKADTALFVASFTKNLAKMLDFDVQIDRFMDLLGEEVQKNIRYRCLST